MTIRQQVSALVRRQRASKIVQQGMAAFKSTGQTPDAAYQNLINLHCMTGGRSNDALHETVRKEFPAYPLGPVSGVLGEISPADAAHAAAQVAETGYYVFPQRLPDAVCDRLTEFASVTPAKLFPHHPGTPEESVYNPDRPQSENYRFAEAQSLTSPDIQALAADLSLLSVAQAYLQCQPILDGVAFWWSTTYSKEASDDAAQIYHFDMDRIKWLKFFFYLTDVTTGTGPHCYVAGSNKTGGAAAELLSRGYVRIPDEDMQKHYSKEAFVEITGPRGSIIAVDTRGFHKGKPLTTGERLLLQLEYADSMFGGVYSRTPLAPGPQTALPEMIRRYPRLYSKFDLKDGSIKDGAK